MTFRRRLQLLGRIITSPGALLTIVALLVALSVWFVGPLLSFGEARPLAAASTRLAILLLVVLVWSVAGAFVLTRQKRADQALLAALRRQHLEEQQANKKLLLAAKADLAAFRNAARSAMRFTGGKRRRFNLFVADRYRIPWYLVIGSENAGKTAFAVNSSPTPLHEAGGLTATAATFHLADHAILVEMAGKFVAQQPTTVTASLWQRMLDHLRKLRPQQPVSGVIAVVDVGELMAMTPETVIDFASTLRRRIHLAMTRLRTRPPVYVVVTKLDLLIGFDEFLDRLSIKERNAALGFPITSPTATGTAASATECFKHGFANVAQKFSQHLLWRLEEEPDKHRRCRAFEFPSQFAAMQDVLEAFITHLTFANDVDGALLVRGMFFASATQSKLSVDALAQDLSLSFAQQPGKLVLRDEETVPRGRAYFLRDLISDVILPESSLGGLTKQAALISRVRGVAANTFLTLALLAPLILWWLGFSEGRAYTVRLMEGVSTARANLATAKPANGTPADFTATLATLDELRRLADEHPSRATLGLYGIASVEEAATQAYHKGINGMLLPFVDSYLREGLGDPQTPAELRLQQLKLYLMLAGQRPVDKKTVELLADSFAERWLPNVRTPQIEARIRAHLAEMASSGAELSLTDMRLVERTRAWLSDYTFARLAYDALESLPQVQRLPAWRPVDHMNLSGPQALARINDSSFWDGIAGHYTRSGLYDTVLQASDLVSIQLSQDLWAMGEPNAAADRSDEVKRIREGLLDLYRVDYIREWDSFLSELTIADGADADQVARSMAIITGDPSPVTELLLAAADQVNLTPPKSDSGAALTTKPLQLANIVTSQRVEIANAVTDHYKDFVESVSSAEGQQSQVSVIVAALKPLYSQINLVATGADILQLGDQPQTLIAGLGEQVDTLPEILQPLFRRILSQAAATTGSASRERISEIWKAIVKPACEATVDNHYPFVPNSSQDALLADFGTLFGPQGLIASFRHDYLTPYIDSSAKPWRWRSRQQLGPSLDDEVLTAFERAQDITAMYFSDTNTPSLDFVVEPVWLEDKARAMQLDLGGPAVVYMHGPPTPSAQKWPPPRLDADAILSMTPELEREPGMLRRQGPWAVFRLFDAGRRLQKSTAGPVSFGFKIGSRKVTLSVAAAAGATNPFAQNILSGFKCPVL